MNAIPSETSPCTGVCKLDQLSRLCRGCGRSVDEIKGWRDYTDAQKRDAKSHLPDRIAALKARGQYLMPDAGT